MTDFALPSASVSDRPSASVSDRLEWGANIVEGRRGTRYERWLKPAIDRLIAAALLVALLPVIVGIALTLLATLGSPIVLRQRRVGRDGQVFPMFKFRTMLPDRRASATPPALSHEDRRTQHKTIRDPRHTPIGRVLRRYSLDELPQLWNVLCGHMSLVGPRPELDHVVARYAEWQHVRHQVKPGITGLWQVTARGQSDGDMHEFTELDLEYLRSVTLATDLKILVRTPLAALGKGN